MSKHYFTTSDGVEIKVHVEGEGPDLVILHGWTGTPVDWAPVLDRLRPHFRSHIWSARPHSAGAHDNGIERMAADVAELIAAFELDRPVLVGHSMGALTAWEYIRQFGCDAISRLVIVDQSPKLLLGEDWQLGLWGRFTAADNERFVDELQRDFPQAVVDLIAYSRVPSSGEWGPGFDTTFLESRRKRLVELEPQPWIDAWQSFVGKDYRDVLPRISVPTLLIYGLQSQYYGQGVADYVHEQIPGSILSLYPNAGHGPQAEEPDRFLEDMLAFAGGRAR